MTERTIATLTTNPVALVVGVLVAAFVAWRVLRLLWRALRRLGAELLFLPVLAIALALTVDGMRHLAVGPMRLQGAESWIPAVFYEAVGLYLAHRAERRLKRSGDMGSYGPLVIVLGVVAGMLAAGAGGNLWASAARLAAPIVAVALWWVRAHDGGKARTAVTWLWSPRRLAIWARVIAPGEHDEVAIDRTRRVRALTRAGHRATEWPRPAAWWYRGRLAALARVSTPDMLAEAAGQVALGRDAISYMAGHGGGHRTGQSAGHPPATGEATMPATMPATIWPPAGHIPGRLTATDAATLAAMATATGWSPDGHSGGHQLGHDAATERPTDQPEDGQPPAADTATPNVTPADAHRDLVRRLKRGQTLTRPAVMDLYGVSDGTAGRWLTKAKAAVADKTQINGKRVREAS